MSEKVLVTPAELSSMMQSEPIVVIDTRDPATYAAGHVPGAVNVHGIDAGRRRRDARQVCRDLRRRRTVGQRDCGRLRAVDEYRLRPIVPRLCAVALSRLSKDQDPARRLCGLDRESLPATTEVPAPSTESFR